MRPAPQETAGLRAPIALEHWLGQDDVPVAVIPCPASKPLPSLGLQAEASGLRLVGPSAASTTGALLEGLCELAAAADLPCDAPDALRQVAVRLGRGLGGLPVDARVAPRRRAGLRMLASRVLLHLVSDTRALVVLDLRGHPAAREEAERLAAPWLAEGPRAFLSRRRQAKGRVLFLLPEDAAGELPRVELEPGPEAPPLLRFVAHNLPAVVDVAWRAAEEHTRRAWAVLSLLGRPVARVELAALLGLPRGDADRAAAGLLNTGVATEGGDGLQLLSGLPAPPHSAGSREQLVSALAGRLRFGREASCALDLLRVDPERLGGDEELRALVPDAVRTLRSAWRHSEAADLARAASESPEAAVELCRTLLDEERREEAAEAIAPVSTEELEGAAPALAELARESIAAQAIQLNSALVQHARLLPAALGAALRAEAAYDAGNPTGALSALAGAAGADADLVRARALLALRRTEEASELLDRTGRDEGGAVHRARLQHNVALTRLGAGRYGEAADGIKRSLAVFDDASLELEGSVALGNLGIALEFGGRYEEARQALAESVARLCVMPAFHGSLRTELALCDLWATMGDLESSRAGLLRAREAAVAAGLPELSADATLRLAVLHLHEGLLDAADGHLSSVFAGRAFRRRNAPTRGVSGRNSLSGAESVGDSLELTAKARIAEALLALARGRSLTRLDEPPEGARLETQRAWRFAHAWQRLESEPAVATEILDALVIEADADGDAALRWQARTLRAAASARSGAGAAAERDLSAAAALVEELAEDLPEGLREAFLEHPWRRRLLDLSAADGDAAEVSTPPLATPGRRPSRSTGKLVGEDPALLETLAVAERFACSDAPVLIEGQSGTGKELVAELIHRWSPRAGGPLVCVNAAALADTLLLSELFGHERGAFTGADRKRLGKFEVARGGTLFLDEIGDISPAAQAALLRVLQDGTFHRVGGTSLVRSDARVIVATNRDLKALVAEGRFRLDLYYRVASLSLELPPLRERKGDIPALCRSLLRDIVGPEREVRVEPAAVRVLAAQDWPGNVRELRNVLERLVHLCEGDTITASMVRRFGVDLGGAKAPEPVEKPAFVELEPGPGFSLKRAQRQLELDLITKALERSEGNIAAAARLLGMTRPMLSRKIKDYGLKRGTP